MLHINGGRYFFGREAIVCNSKIKLVISTNNCKLVIIKCDLKVEEDCCTRLLLNIKDNTGEAPVYTFSYKLVKKWSIGIDWVLFEFFF